MTVPVLATVVLMPKNGLVEDRVNMDLSFDAADATPGTLNGIATSIVSLINTQATQVQPLSKYLSPVVDRAATQQIKFFVLTGHLDGSPHGSPVQTNSWTLVGAALSDACPSEVAVAFSFHGDLTGVSETAANPTPPPAVIRPAARRRGRFFFGPVNLTILSNDATSLEAIVKAQFISDADIAVTRFMDTRPDFAVWSRRNATLYRVSPNGGWSIDNAFDTQRRRGKAASSRTVIWP